MAEAYDLVCVGFGPAALAVAVALHDKGVDARVLFLEKQRSFAWHAGMLLPRARMQISFLKDLATLRDPRSHFTFLNYLKSRGRLETFTNLNTFLPLREEFNDYFSWVAGHFEHQVRYGTCVTSIAPRHSDGRSVSSWSATGTDVETAEALSFFARHVIIAQGGSPKLPPALASLGEKVVHSSQYLAKVPPILERQTEPVRVAVLGSGQSSAEIFDDLTSRLPDSTVRLFFADSALRPSDDSPFVNEIFDSHQVSNFYALPAASKQAILQKNRSTNYSVVRGPLLEHLYEGQYQQRVRDPDESTWKHRICGSRSLQDARLTKDGKVELLFQNPRTAEEIAEPGWDTVIAGTGYVRNAHDHLLKSAAGLIEFDRDGAMPVSREYKVRTRPGAVRSDSGIWLQGCCEASHGLSDSLLSILSTRSGELVDAIFESRLRSRYHVMQKKGS